MDIQAVARQQSRRDALESVMCFLACVTELRYELGSHWPRSVCDVGCGDGHIVKAAGAMGIEGCGIDLGFGIGAVIEHAHEPFTRSKLIGADLANPIEIGVHTADLVLCWEVAEHVAPSSADVLCDTLHGLARRDGSVLLFSAATPGQGGAGHVNEQPHEYWQAKLETRGLHFHARLTFVLRAVCEVVAPNAWWYGKNMQVFM
jgi:2-polyprenyl-3-methyl-5-hydroxy-6-metoxy-1,4-benzoquinol methylase